MEKEEPTVESSSKKLEKEEPTVEPNNALADEIPNNNENSKVRTRRDTSILTLAEEKNFSVGPAGTPNHTLYPWITGGEGKWNRDTKGNIVGNANIHLSGVWTAVWRYSIKGQAQYADGNKEIIKKYQSKSFVAPGSGLNRVKMDWNLDFDLGGNEYDHRRPVTFVFWLFKNTISLDETPPTPPIPPVPPLVPEIKTNATNAKDNTKVIPAEEKVQVKDVVDYKNLIPGKEYELQGKLMDKATGKALVVDGKEVTASKKFTPTNATGQEALIFEFNASALNGKKIVVFEDLKQDGKQVATHSDINDVNQTVEVPEKPEVPNKPKVPNKPEPSSKTFPMTGAVLENTLACLGAITLLLTGILIFFKKNWLNDRKR
ncbi:TPA: VaFE repeat-containing surface-anchored protein [Enterococcus faecalis]|nr:VaFE repeat-containing surface-anchored protein [Enterococcus faecalis]HDH7721430.1 VaFE repeat-containing surface-anchored protein [Enterococcus faecalis]